ncbi:MAG TPA: hypothetical protein VN282_11315 [Pyrinomonadaceae bacterium]|nr:hypothetical protein [Pyrinomonadaceae bacterium]
MTILMNVLSKLSLEAFGIGMPRIAWHLAPPNVVCQYAERVTTPTPGLPQVQGLPLTLQGLTNNQTAPAPWVALLAGSTRKINSSADIGFPLVRADGQLENETGLLITVFPQLYARLQRLYSVLLEGPPPPLPGAPPAPPPPRVPARPVPRHFFYVEPDNAFAGTNYDNVNPGEEIGNFGAMRVYDADGMPIDPVAMLYAFSVLMSFHPTLQWLPELMLGPVLMPGILAVAGVLTQANAGPQPDVRIRLCDEAGQPLNGVGLGGLNAFDANNGLFNLAGGLGGVINVTPPPPGGTLAGRLVGSPNGGRLGAAFAPPALTYAPPGPVAPFNTTPPALMPPPTPPFPPSPVVMPVIYRDFFTIRVLNVDQFLLGTPPPNFAAPPGAPSLEQRPVVRVNEQLALLDNGNDLLAAAESALAGAAAQSQCVAQTIRDDFVVPAVAGPASQWPTFPLGAAPPAVALPRNLDNVLTFTANVVADGNGNPTVDVMLTIGNVVIPQPGGGAAAGGVAVRVYPRKFVADAREERGDGAGAAVPVGATTALFLLRDPFSRIHEDGTNLGPIPSNAVLHFDMCVVSPTDARIYGNVAVPVTQATIPAPAPTPNVNNFGPNPPGGGPVDCGTCQSEILGLDPPPVGGPVAFFMNSLGGLAEPNPREATRIPTMAHRDLLVAGYTGPGPGPWSAAVAGGRLEPETHSADARRGAPGGLGGRETQVAGVATAGGLLAYDVARMALRRSRIIPERLMNLVNPLWDAPAAPPPANGTFAGALLQSAPPLASTPSFFFLRNDMGAFANFLQNPPPPYTLDSLINWVVTTLQGKTVVFTDPETGNPLIDPVTGNPITVQVDQVMPDLLSDPVNNDGVLQVINGLPTTTPPPDPRKDRARDELERELITSVYGRRDTEWALAAAIARAPLHLHRKPRFLLDQRGHGRGAASG